MGWGRGVMLNPPRPSDESFRLEALHRLGLMDTPSEPRFDRIVQLAVRRFGVRTALISLVDAERLWLKAKVGVDFCERNRSGPRPYPGYGPDRSDEPSQVVMSDGLRKPCSRAMLTLRR